MDNLVRKTTLKLFPAIALLSLGCTGTAEAVQGSFINLGFEQPSLPLGVQTCPKSIVGSVILTSSDVPGWDTTHGAGDIWCTNNGGTTAFQNAVSGTKAIDIWKSGEVELDNPRIVSSEGKQHAELSAWVKSRLYQTVCLLQGEDVKWEFSHTHRDNPSEAIDFNISNTTGLLQQTIVRAPSNTLPGTGTSVRCLALIKPSVL